MLFLQKRSVHKLLPFKLLEEELIRDEYTLNITLWEFVTLWLAAQEKAIVLRTMEYIKVKKILGTFRLNRVFVEFYDDVWTH